MDAADEASFADFVRGRSASLLRTAYLLTGDRHAAEDLLQTALAKSYARWTRLRSRDAAEAYVRRVLVTTRTDGWRRRRVSELPVAAVPERPGDERPDDVVERDAVWRSVLALPPRQRAVVVLRYYEDLDDERIAALLGCSEVTVRTQASRAVARLRAEALEDVAAAGRERGNR